MIAFDMSRGAGMFTGGPESLQAAGGLSHFPPKF